MARPKKTEKKTKAIASSQSLSSFVKAICDVMRRSNCASALQYVPELTWILFLRILDAQEARDQEKAEAVGASFTPALQTAKDVVVASQTITDPTDLIGHIGRAVLTDLLPPRRPRTSVRKVKSPLSRYNKKDPYRPDRSTPITSLTTTLADPQPQPTTREPTSLTTSLGP